MDPGPVFRFSTETGDPVRLVEVRITEVGEELPSWWLVLDDGWREDAVLLGLITADEAESAGVTVTRRLDNDLGKLVADIGVVVHQLRYGEVPPGFRQQGRLEPLRSNHLYEIVATGNTLGSLEFYA